MRSVLHSSCNASRRAREERVVDQDRGDLNPDENVWQAISKVRPFAVDVSGGVEAAKGIKDAEKIAAFMRGVQNV